MKKLLSILILLLFLSSAIKAQVYYHFYTPQTNSIMLHSVHSGIVYNQTGVVISAVIDVQVFDENESLVYHRQSPPVTFQNGKTDIYEMYYGSSKPIVSKGIKPSTFFLNHRIQYSLLHPLDKVSVICRYEVFTKNYGPQNGFRYDANRDFQCVPMSLEIAAREHYFFDEGVKLTHEITLPKATKKELSKKDISIDINRSKLFLMKDNGGKDYLKERSIKEQERNEYVRGQAREGKFIATTKLYQALSLPTLSEDDRLATFETQAFSIPSMATNIMTEGSIVLLEHTDELITEKITVELQEGVRTKINNTIIEWTINGRGACMNGPYDIANANTPLKVKSIKFLNPMVTSCGDSRGHEKNIKVKKSDLPYTAELEITYHQPIVREVFFKNNFNLSLDDSFIKMEDDHFTDQSISKISISQNTRWIKDGINVEFPIESGTPGYNPIFSSIEILDERGEKLDLGKVELTKESTFEDISISLYMEKMPPKGTRYLTANFNLAMETDLEETEDFYISLKDFQNLPIQEIDGLPITFYKDGNYDNTYQICMQKGIRTYSGIPNRTITQVQVLSRKKDKVLNTSQTKYSFEVPDEEHEYQIKITVKKKKTDYVPLKKKIAIGSVIPSNRWEKASDPEHAAIAARNRKRQQEAKKITPSPQPVSEVKKVAEVMPMFPGCEEIENYSQRYKCSTDKFQAYIFSHPEYLKIANEVKNRRAIVTFVVEKDGSLSDVQTMQSRDGKFFEAIKKVLYDLKSKNILWHSGIDKGEKVRVKFTLPVMY